MNTDSVALRLLLVFCFAASSLGATQAMSPGQAAERGRMLVVDSPEFLADTSRAWVPADGFQNLPALAFDGANFLVAWSDTFLSAVYGTRMTPDGRILDPDRIRIASIDTTVIHPPEVRGVAWNGDVFLVVWQAEGRREGQRDVWAARVSRNGVLLDPAGIAIDTAFNDQMYPSAGSDGTGFFVSWLDLETGAWVVQGTRLNAQGQVVDTPSINISTWNPRCDNTAVGFCGSNYLVTWNQNNDTIRGARVSPQGVVLDSLSFVISRTPRTQRHVALCCNGEEYLATWESGRSLAWNVYGARITPEGAVLDTAGIPLSATPRTQRWPTLASQGDTFAAFWVDWRDSLDPSIYCTRVSAEGRVVDSLGIRVSSLEMRLASTTTSVMAAAGDGENVGLVWPRWLSRTGDDIVSTRLSPQGVVLDPEPMTITTQPNDQQMPVAGWNGTGFLAVWADHCRDSTRDIRAARIAPDGMVLDPSGITVSAARLDQFGPAVGFDGASGSLVAWADNRNGTDYDVYCARVTPEGVVLDTSGIPVSTARRNQGPPAVAFGTSDYFLVWQDFRNSTWDIYGARVSPTGAVL
jgi:hypothetical protein